jgi:hypothetical protein
MRFARARGPTVWRPDPAAMQISSDPLGQLASPFNMDQASPEPAMRQQVIDQAALNGMLGSPAPLSPSPFAPSGPAADDEPSPWFTNATHQLLLACLIIGGMLLAMSSGVFETDTARRLRGFQQAGIEAGEYESVESFVARQGNEFAGLPRGRLLGLSEGLFHAGAKGVWVCNIARHGNQRSSNTLLIELPDDPSARSAILSKQVPTADLREPVAKDSGQRFLRLAF